MVRALVVTASVAIAIAAFAACGPTAQPTCTGQTCQCKDSTCTCNGGTTCDIQCGTFPGCNADCTNVADCNAQCRDHCTGKCNGGNGTGTCSMQCNDNCDYDCSNSASCTVTVGNAGTINCTGA